MDSTIFIAPKELLLKIDGTRAPLPDSFPSYFWPYKETQVAFSRNTLQVLSKWAKEDFQVSSFLDTATPHAISKEDWKALDSRIYWSVASYFQDAPVDNILTEIRVLLWTQKHLAIEYIGRSVQPDIPTLLAPDVVPGQEFNYDILFGKRKYTWRALSADSPPPEANTKAKFSYLRQWFQDPDARVVLSFGGGGVRFFSTVAVLKLLEMLEVRSNIAEIWGTSGGAVIGWMAAIGTSIRFIEKTAYDIYNERLEYITLRKSPIKSIWKNLQQMWKGGFKAINGGGLISLQDTLAGHVRTVYSDPAHFISAGAPAEIPMYALTCSFDQKTCFALTSNEKGIPESCKDFIFLTDPITAVRASTAIPFIIAGQPFEMPNGAQTTLYDGTFGELIPLLLPSLKWHREREASPKETQKKLKIFYVDILSDFLKVDVFGIKLSFFSDWFKVAQSISGLCEVALNQTHHDLVELVEANPNVEVLGIRFDPEKREILDVNLIPYFLQEGRKTFLEQFEILNEQLRNRRSKMEETA